LNNKGEGFRADAVCSLVEDQEQYRRLRTRLGAPKAITAMAYRMLKYGQQYLDQGTDYYEQRYRNQ
jgi:hypothetical protein